LLREARNSLTSLKSKPFLSLGACAPLLPNPKRGKESLVASGIKTTPEPFQTSARYVYSIARKFGKEGFIRRRKQEEIYPAEGSPLGIEEARA
jgi:hypothetical protein